MASGYSMKDAAKKIGVHYMTLYRWEKNRKVPPPKRIARTNARIYTDADIAVIKEWADQVIDPGETLAQ
jgi:DNA-binding transcriptional MerR regulator